MDRFFITVEEMDNKWQGYLEDVGEVGRVILR